MRWVTRTCPYVDRTASAWLIKRFIDKNAEFVFIKWPREKPDPSLGVPFDIRGVELGHRDGKCTFEVIVEKYKIVDPIVKKIAEVVHAADIEEDIDKSPLARGIKAILNGLRYMYKDDYKVLEEGIKIWDALYAHFKILEIMERYSEELKSMDRIGRIAFLRDRVSEAVERIK